jgi:hypothetical protein
VDVVKACQETPDEWRPRLSLGTTKE